MVFLNRMVRAGFVEKGIFDLTKKVKNMSTQKLVHQCS